MKIRRGFVSNSSSSSYMCEVCEGIAEGWDITLRQASMYECERGHTVHESCTPDFDLRMEKATLDAFNELTDERKQELDITPEIAANPDRLAEYMEGEMEEWRYDAREALCPICTLDELTTEDELAYYRQKHGYDSESTLKEIRDKFETYSGFLKFFEKDKQDEGCPGV